MICVFDIESVPDAQTLKSVFGYEGSEKEICVQALKAHEEKTGSTFLPHVFHKVVAISAVIANDFGEFIKVNSLKGDDEGSLVADFLNFLDSHQPKLVSYNGRTFDLPLLMLRALRYNLTCNAYYEIDNRELNKSKWENYRTRYSERFHVDLMDSMSEYGAVRGMRLDHICSMANLPGKYDVSGDQVMELFFDGEIEKIKEYCESDVLNTYWLYLKYELLKTNLTVQDYGKYLSIMQENLQNGKSYTDVFSSYIDEEIKRIQK